MVFVHPLRWLFELAIELRFGANFCLFFIVCQTLSVRTNGDSSVNWIDFDSMFPEFVAFQATPEG